MPMDQAGEVASQPTTKARMAVADDARNGLRKDGFENNLRMVSSDQIANRRGLNKIISGPMGAR